MQCDVTTSIRHYDLGANRGWITKNVFRLSIPAQGDDGWMFKELDVVVPASQQGLLKVAGLSVRNAPEDPNPQGSH
jgi:hypothetical protein